MTGETIVVYIDPVQVNLQKNNNYSLYLAKKVSGHFTVIWQSKGPVTTSTSLSYGYRNKFQIATPSFQVNYGTVTKTAGSVSFSSGGKAVDINTGQTTTLTKNGIFEPAVNKGVTGVISVDNHLQHNPNEILLDSGGHPIFVNTKSGMDIGTAELTPIDEYQLWFDNYQATGTIIADNVSNRKVVTFDGGTAVKTISYDKNGKWLDGKLSSSGVALEAMVEAGGLGVVVLATFSTALTGAAVTYLLSNLINKFQDGLRPKKITAGIGGLLLTVEFDNESIAANGNLSLDRYEAAVNNALLAAQIDGAPGLEDEHWTVNEPELEVSY